MPKGHYNRKSAPLQPSTGEQTVTQTRPAHIDNGEEARGNVNARGNQTRTQPEPDAALSALGENVTPLRATKIDPDSPLAKARSAMADGGVAKHRLLTETKQRLAEAADMLREGGVKAREAGKIAEVEAVKLLDARVNRLISAEELNELLGGSFGFKPKGGGDNPVPAGHPDAGKTPFGQGEAIRKRVVRFVQAAEYLDGSGEASKFFDGLPKKDIQTEINRVRSGDISIWQSYDNLGKIKREAVTAIEPAFDPKRVAKFAEGLRQPKLAEAFNNNPALVAAYLAVYDMIAAVNNEAAALAKKAA